MNKSERIFTGLICSIGRRQSEVREQIRAEERTEVLQVEECIAKLEQEMADLKKRDAEAALANRHTHCLCRDFSLCVH